MGRAGTKLGSRTGRAGTRMGNDGWLGDARHLQEETETREARRAFAPARTPRSPSQLTMSTNTPRNSARHCRPSWLRSRSQPLTRARGQP